MTAEEHRTDLDTVLAYHDQTKHHPDRFARSLGYMDWDTRPDPFRRYDGAAILRLDEVAPGPDPQYDALFGPAAIAPRDADRAAVSQLLYDSLALSAWKEIGASRWSLRVNPSSGNLHPTEGYMVTGPVPGLADDPGLYHYSPYLHGLELRATLSGRDWSDLGGDLPAGSMLLGLTSIHWRESWKYGERAFRYCHHDAGHAMAAVALAAAALGWRADLLEGWTDGELAVLLGVSGRRGIEAEHPDGLLLLSPAASRLPANRLRTHRPGPDLLQRLSGLEPAGEPNPLSRTHHEWPIIDAVAAATARRRPPPPDFWEPCRPDPVPPPVRMRDIPARGIIRRRRSAVAMDGRTGLDRDTFAGMIERLMPGEGRVPFDSLPWTPAVHLLLFVHRVDGVDPGLYGLVRAPGALAGLRDAMRPEFEWIRPDGFPEELPLYRLAGGDVRDAARFVSCGQDIAADGAFAAAMIAEFEPSLRRWGAWFYRRLHWEAGAIGQVLYLEAEAAGIRGTGIGCFFDDAVHRIAGLSGRRYQDLYHFTVGGPVHDTRLRTVPAYAHLQDR